MAMSFCSACCLIRSTDVALALSFPSVINSSTLRSRGVGLVLDQQDPHRSQCTRWARKTIRRAGLTVDDRSSPHKRQENTRRALELLSPGTVPPCEKQGG